VASWPCYRCLSVCAPRIGTYIVNLSFGNFFSTRSNSKLVAYFLLQEDIMGFRLRLQMAHALDLTLPQIFITGPSSQSSSQRAHLFIEGMGKAFTSLGRQRIQVLPSHDILCNPRPSLGIHCPFATNSYTLIFLAASIGDIFKRSDRTKPMAFGDF
jgi:hypothetical protein